MYKIWTTRLLHSVFLLIISALAIESVAAQSKPAPQPTDGTAKPANSNKPDNAKLTPPPGKMRGLTNEMRKAAAIRNRDRANHPTPNGTPQGKQNGGKQ